MSLWLIGMMGSGKTTVGLLVADRTGAPFLDTDQLVEDQAGCSVGEIFATEGDAGFRIREKAAVSRAAAEANAIIATGGGVVLDTENVEKMRDSGPVIWLQAPLSTLAERLVAAHDRPLLEDDPLATLIDLWARRSSAYEAAADHIIDTEGVGPQRVAVLVEEIWNES